jgi:hypothetical protein
MVSNQVVVLSSRDIKRLNAISPNRKIDPSIVDDLDPGGYHVTKWAILLDDGECVRISLLLKMRDTMEPGDGVVDCSLSEYLNLNRVEVSLDEEPEQGE